MSGRAEEMSREWQHVLCPCPDRDHHRLRANSLSIFEDNSFNPIIVFVQGDESRLFAQCDAEQFRAFNQRRNHASAFDISRVGIEETIVKALRRKRRETFVHSG